LSTDLRRASCACGGECPHCRAERQARPKLTINNPGDLFEQEADRTADEIMHAPELDASPGMRSAAVAKIAPVSRAHAIGRLQRKCACGGSTGTFGECAVCQDARGDTLQRDAVGPTESEVAPPIVHDVLRSPGEPLDDATRAFMEPRFGRDFGDVRVHTGATASKSARAIGAAAYTVDRNIVFAPGYYAPATVAGRRLIAHELAHTVQQGAGAPSVGHTPLPIQTGARGTLQMVGECEGKSLRNCGGSCIPASGGTGICGWSGTVKYGCICIPRDQPMSRGPGPEIIPPLLTAYMLAKMYQMATTAAPAGALAGGGTVAVSTTAASTTTAAGGTTAAAGAATGGAAAGEATAAGAIAGGGAGAVVAVALPVIALVGVFVALGAGYAEARTAVRNESTMSGFSQGFVMGLLGWEWHQAVDRFGVWSATPTPSDEALGYIKANAYNGGLRAGFEAGSKLSPDMKKAYLREIRKLAGRRGTTSWSRLDQISYVIDLAAVARVHFLRPE
jgi:hypothetical protein